MHRLPRQQLSIDRNIEAGAQFLTEFDRYVPVSVAFWVIPADSRGAYLYVASEQLDDGDFSGAYREVLARSRQIPWLDPFEVKLIGSSDPMAREAIAIRDRYSASLATHFGGPSLGGFGIDGAYIYPEIHALSVRS